MSDRVIFDAKEKGIKAAPDRFFQLVKEATGQVMEIGEQYAKEEAPSSVLKGSKGGRGGITNRVEDRKPRIIGYLDATALNRETGYNYALGLYRGTGVYGPRKKRIFPVRKRVLAWVEWGDRPKTPQGWKSARLEKRARYARSIKGMKPNKYLDRGMKRAIQKAPGIFDRHISRMNQEVK